MRAIAIVLYRRDHGFLYRERMPHQKMIGEKLGRYLIVEEIGRGSLGTVYRAEDSEGCTVALKLVRSGILCSMEKREKFLQCILTASAFQHKSICPILEIGDDNDDFFIVTPFVRGKRLDQCLGKPFPWPDAMDIARLLAAPLEMIHNSGAVHRGLKPGNIWMLDTTEPQILLTDCCISRFTEIPKRGRFASGDHGLDFADTMIPLDALGYMSPEQVRGEPVDSRTDIFSFGVLLYEILTGRHPFDARTSLSRISAILEDMPAPIASQPAEISPELDFIMRKALAKNREDRYQSISAMMMDLGSLHDGAHGKLRAPVPSVLRKWLACLRGRLK